MAGREVNFDIVAKDKASDVLDDVAKEAAKVEKLDPTVTVDADTSDAKHTLDGMDDQLDKLTDADKVVVLALRAGAAKAELTDLATDLATIDKSSPDVDVKFDRYAEVSGQLDQLEQKMTDIAGTSLDPDVGDKARTRLAGIGEEAGKTQGAVHSMAGNALGDFAATTSGIGPLGEAIGQLTEMAAGGEAGLKDLATAGLGLGAVAGAMVIVNLAMKSFADAAKRAAEIKKFDTDDVEAFTKALKEGRDVTDDYIDRMTELGKVSAHVIPDVGTKFDEALGKIMDITPLLHDAGISAADFANGVTGSADDLARFTAAVEATNLSVEQQQLLLSAAAAEYDNLATAADNAKQFHDVFGDQAKQVELFNQATEEMRNKLALASTAANKFADKIADGTRGLRDMTGAYQRLSDAISGDQSFIDLADQIANVEDAGVAAIDAQKEADDARKKHAKDATDQQREAEQAMRDYQTAVNQTKQEIIDLATTAGANPVELQATLDKVDQGDLAGAKADAEAWSKRNPVVLTAELRVALIKALGSGLGPAVIVPGSAPTTNVTNFLAVPDARRQAVQAQRTARVNGRR